MTKVFELFSCARPLLKTVEVHIEKRGSVGGGFVPLDLRRSRDFGVILGYLGTVTVVKMA